MAKFILYFFILFSFFSFPPETIANGICVGDLLSNRMTLKDIKFCVQISAEESSLQNIKALTSEIKEEIEREFWKEGIKVLPEKECPLSPHLVLYITLLELQKVAGFVFLFDLRLQQEVYLEKDIYFFFLKPNYQYIKAPTWSCSLVGIVPELNGVKKYIPKLLDTFIDAYKYANSKE